MRRSGKLHIASRAAVVTVAVVLPWAAEAQGRLTPAKYVGPQCLATAIPTVVESLGRVTAGREPSMQIFGPGDAVFISPESTGVRVGETYLLYRVDGEVRHPRTEEIFGRAINLLGQIEVFQIDEGRAMGRITQSCAEIEPGDHLHALLADSVAGDVDFEPISPDFLLTELEADGTVVHGFSESLSQSDSPDREVMANWETYAAGDVVTIDQGLGDGWETDSRVLLYTSTPEVAAPDDKLKTEPIVLGQGLVIYATEYTSVVMITDGAGTVRRGSRARRLQD
ncbi:MAG: hypothetical protein GKS06_18240 [Acidobacteria bacterium]|nr:hypothetical protein [Acidobacteriota bacterium]